MSIFTRIAVICFLTTLNVLYAQSETTRTELYYGIAKGNYLIGDLQGARKSVEQVLKLNPDYIPALTLKARIQLDQGLPEMALRSLEQAIKLEPKNVEHQRLKVVILGNMDEKDSAINVVENIVKSTSVDDKEHRLSNKLRTQADRIDQAIEDLQHITGRQPENFEALITLASLYALAERWNSLQTMLTSIAVNPELQDIVLYFEGRIALANERVGTAREKFEAALRLLPENSSQLLASIEFYQAICFEKMGRFEESAAKIIQSLESGFCPETIADTTTVCRALIRTGEASRAIKQLESLVVNHVNLPTEVWNMLGRAHMANNSKTLALSAFNQSLSIQPNQPETLALRGSLLRAIGDLEGAAADMEKAIDMEPENPAIIYSLGLIYFQLGDLVKAKQLIGKSMQQIPDNPGIRLLYALLAYNTEANNGDIQDALETYLNDTAASQQTNESAFYLEYILTAEKNAQEAIRKLQQRIQSTSATPMLRNFLGYVQDKLDRKAVLDAAGHAESPETARKQLCEAAYWLAQHELVHKRTEKATELLKIAIRIGSADYSEYLFAQWQLK